MHIEKEAIYLDERLIKQWGEVQKAQERLNDAVVVLMFAKEGFRRQFARCKEISSRLAEKQGELSFEYSEERYYYLERRKTVIPLIEQIDAIQAQIDERGSLIASLEVAIEDEEARPRRHRNTFSIICFKRQISEIRSEIIELVDVIKEVRMELFIKTHAFPKCPNSDKIAQLECEISNLEKEREQAHVERDRLKADLEKAEALRARRKNAFVSIYSQFRLRANMIERKGEWDVDQIIDKNLPMHIDRQEVKVVYWDDGRVQVYYGGDGRPDGENHGHMTISPEGRVLFHRRPGEDRH